ARVLVDPMHDTWTPDPTDSFQRIAAMGEERVDQGLVPVARRRMHNQARRLVDHDEGPVLVDDIERDLLRDRPVRDRRGDDYANRRTCTNALRWIGGDGAVQADPALFDKRLDP